MFRRILFVSVAVGTPLAGYKLYTPFPKPACQDEDRYKYAKPTSVPNPNILTKQPHTIGVIGAGLGGLAVAKELGM
jgi:hypothetical protein